MVSDGRSWPIRIPYGTLIWQLYKRSVKARYGNTSLKGAWMWVAPLAQIALFSVVFSWVIPLPVARSRGALHYIFFLWPSLVAWIAVQEGILMSSRGFISYREIVKGTRFPIQILSICDNLIAITFQCVGILILIVFLLRKGDLWLGGLWLLPLLLLLQITMTIGVGWIVSAFNIYFRDLEYVLMTFLPFLFYFSPILYDFDLVPPLFQRFMLLNPLTPFALSYRAILFHQTLPDSEWLLGAIGHAGFFAVIGLLVFRALARDLADEL